MLLMEGAISHGVKRIRLHVLSGEAARRLWDLSGLYGSAPATAKAETHSRHPLVSNILPSVLFPIAADGRDVNDDTAVAWVERLHGDCGKLSGQHSVDVSWASGSSSCAGDWVICMVCCAAGALALPRAAAVTALLLTLHAALC